MKNLPATLYLASGHTVPVPYSAALLAFVHLDIEVRNPMLSGCGRFNVDPQAYGFAPHHTGGGCMALRKDMKRGEYLLLTDSSGGHIPEQGDQAVLGRYYADGTPAMTIDLVDVPMEE